MKSSSFFTRSIVLGTTPLAALVPSAPASATAAPQPVTMKAACANTRAKLYATPKS